MRHLCIRGCALIGWRIPVLPKRVRRSQFGRVSRVSIQERLPPRYSHESCGDNSARLIHRVTRDPRVKCSHCRFTAFTARTKKNPSKLHAEHGSGIVLPRSTSQPSTHRSAAEFHFRAAHATMALDVSRFFSVLLCGLDFSPCTCEIDATEQESEKPGGRQGPP